MAPSTLYTMYIALVVWYILFVTEIRHAFRFLVGFTFYFKCSAVIVFGNIIIAQYGRFLIDDIVFVRLVVVVFRNFVFLVFRH